MTVQESVRPSSTLVVYNWSGLELRTYGFDPETCDRYKEALFTAYTAHFNQFREPTRKQYIHHPLGIFQILRQAGVPLTEEAMYVAVLLHDTVEKTNYFHGGSGNYPFGAPETVANNIERNFGKTVARYVMGMSKDISGRPDPEFEAGRMKRLTSEPQIGIIALADWLESLRNRTFPGEKEKTAYHAKIKPLVAGVYNTLKNDEFTPAYLRGPREYLITEIVGEIGPVLNSVHTT